ncbi:MAG: GEVED domain-containing protein [Bacteroidota bacterium]|jgi:PKD repeat protein
MKTKQHLLAFFLLMSFGMYAAPYCIPTSTNGTTGGDFINGVNLGTINNQNTGSTTGTTYNDYSNLSTDISQAGTFSLTINGGTFANGFYGAWIDYNGDSTFTANEKLGQVQTNTPNQSVTITFTVPLTAGLGTKRLRVRSARNTNNMDPCQNYTRGETEDYTVNILVGGGNGPIAYFGAVQPSITLGNTVDFVDSTSFNPTSWQWTFAGGTPSSSSVQNPTGISYSAVGCYAVTLTATNANGSNTLTRTCYIIVNPANPFCNTLYSANCSGTNNINAVNITNTSLNNAGTGCNSLSGTAYSIFPESGNTTATLYRGQSYQLNVTSASNNSSIAAWIDFNMNNVFDSTEFVSVASPAVQNLASSVIISIPSTISLGTLRMRIRTRVAGGGGGGSNVILSTQACTLFNGGEAEDYILTIADAPPVIPTANFTADSLTITAGQNVDFSDLSAGLPTSWSWTFDGGLPSTSTSQNPQNIVFNVPGCYNVTLVASNAQGSNTLSQSCYITVLAPAYCSVLHQVNCSANDFISAVAIPSTTLINDSTACDALNGNGYSIWPAVGNTTGSLYQTGTYQINVTTNANRIIGMWIDYNHSTTFDSTEFVLVSSNATANVMANASFTVPANALIGPTMMRIRSRNVTGTLTSIDACTLFGSGETEDYTITIQSPPTIPPAAAFIANPITVAIGQNVNFTDLSSNLPTGWSWTFSGAIPSVSTSQNPQNIVYNAVGCYAVSLTATNAYGSNTLEIPCYINVVIPPYCSTLHTTNCSAADNINTVSIANTSINNANTGCNGSPTSNAYSVFPVSASTSDTLLQGYTYPISVTTTANRIIACWIDYNQNGTFENSEYSSIAAASVANVASTANITIPTNALLGNTRMRIRSRNVTGTITAADACTLFGSGETEDYTITIGAAPQIPPIAAFTADSVAITIGQNVDFSDISTNIPTTWSWSFPGGQPSTSDVQNPQNIVYSAPGCYPVTLIVTNAYGSDTATINCYINVTPPPYCSTLQSNNCGGGGGGGGGFINTVAIASTNFNNANTGCAGNPYIIYPPIANTTATLNRGTNYNISVTTTTSQKVGIWIDFNHNYLFDASEFSLVANATPANIPATISVLIPSSAFVGQTGMRVRCVNANATLTAANACTSNANGETEDYTITIGAGGNNPPIVDFTANFTSISPFGSINFSDNSSNTPTEWTWTFPGGSPSTSSNQNPTGIIYGSPGCYDVKLVATNAFGSDSLTKPCYINVTSASTFCVPTHTTACTNSYINTVQITGTSLNNSNSGCNNITSQGYSIWPASGSTTAQLNRNQSYNLKVTCNIGSRISVWIDYNHNNIFETTEWTQVTAGSQPNIASTVSIFVPSTAVAGPTGMRIRSITTPTGGGGGGVNGAANSCTTFASGESEDYTITIFDPTLIPVANFTNSSATTICVGNTVSFTDLSTNTPNVWYWDLPGSTNGFSTLQNPTVTYDSAGVFPVTLTATNGNGSGTFTINSFVTVNAIPNLNAGASATICLGSNVQLQATGGSTYVWSPSAGLSNSTVANPIANPSNTTLYSVTTISNGCSATDTLLITVNSAFANAGSDVSVCDGGSVNLNATGEGTFLWSPSAGLSDATIANPIANPISTTIYSVLVTNNGCTATDEVVVSINSINANAGQDISICSGTPGTLNASGGNEYFWSPSLGLSNATIANPIANPSQTTTYQVLVLNSTNGCSAIDSITVTVVGTDVTAGLDITVCPANTAQLLASGGSSYSWSPSTNLSAADISNPIFTAGSSTSYVVTILESGCTFVDTINVTVGIVTADAGIDTSICFGGTTQIIATGGASYLWTPATGLSNSSIANPIASPSVTTTYTVVSSSGSCSATDQITITVVPAVTANAGTDVVICSGSSATLSSTGGSSYEWSPSIGLSNAAVANPVASPTATTSYVVNVSNGICSATDTIVVSVQNLNVDASITGLSNTICSGDSLQLNASASGTASFSWIPSVGLSSPSNAITMASPALTTDYVVTANDGVCFVTDTVTIVVNTAPAANITVNGSTSICEGSSTLLICPLGAPITDYLWSNGAVSNEINVTASGCFNVTITDSNGCTSVSEPTCIIVNPLPQTPVIILNGDGSISASIVAPSYIWNLNGVQLTETTQTIYPTINGVYTVSAVSDSGCLSGISETFDYLITKTTAQNKTETISIYPNPATNIFIISAEFEHSTQIKISMTDISGRVVRVIESGSLYKSYLKEINISDLTNGIYFITFSNDDKTITRKLLKE